MSTKENKVKILCQQALSLVELVCEEAEKNGLTDKPYYLDFEDAINSISVKDHSINFKKD